MSRSSSAARCVYFGVWILCAGLLNAWSDAQDRGELAVDPADTVRFRVVSGPGLVVYVTTMTFASVDWIMSLDPHWYSTIFGFLLRRRPGPRGACACHYRARDAEPMSSHWRRT